MYFIKFELVDSTSIISAQSSSFLIHFSGSVNKFKLKCVKLNSVSIMEDHCVHFILDQERKLKV